MTGFENTANVAEETIDPHRSFPRSLIGGMITAGVIYVLVSMAAALTVSVDDLAASPAALLEVVEQGILPISTDFMSTLFSVIALIAITNTTLVAIVTQPRILYGMAKEDVVPGVFSKIHSSRRSPWVGLLFSATVVCALLVVGAVAPNVEGAPLIERLSLVTVVFLLFIYALVIVSCLKLRGHDESERTYRANTPLLILGLLGNIAILGYVIYDDPTSLYWCAGLVAVGVVLFLIEYLFGKRTRPPGAERGDPEAATGTGA
jgi:amino acid transporter